MNIKIKMALGLVLALGLGSMAAQADPPEVYAGVGWGQYKLQFDDDRFDTDFDDDNDAWRFFFGGQFTDTLGAEISLYEFDDTEDVGLTTELEGASIAGTFSAPVWEDRFDIFGKLGWFFWEADVNDQVGPFGTQDYDGDDFFYGVGLKFQLADAFDLRVEYDRFELQDTFEPDLDYASASLQFNF